MLAEGDDDMKKHWRVEDGVIVNDGQGVYLTTDKDYGDIELLIDFKIGPKGDSGVYLRGTPQVQIWDFSEPSYARMGADKGSGGLWNNSAGAPGKDPLVRADNPIDQWNTFRIIQLGSRTTVYLNDKLVVDNAIHENYWNRSVPIPARGPIQLQTHDHEIHWRNIAVREIPPDLANQILARHNADGFQSIIGSQGLDSWGGPIDNYELAGRHIAMQAAPRRHDLLQEGAHRLHGQARVQAAARRQQRPGDPLPRRRRYGLRGHVRASDPRRRSIPSSPSRSTRARPMARRTAWWRPTKAI